MIVVLVVFVLNEVHDLVIVVISRSHIPDLNFVTKPADQRLTQ